MRPFGCSTPSTGVRPGPHPRQWSGRALLQPLLLARPLGVRSVVPRTLYYVAKQEAHDNPIIGPFIRLFGTSSVRRGESDREAIRIMREVVRRGDALGMFPEGTRQEREPGEVKSGAADDRGAGGSAGRLRLRSTGRRTGGSATCTRSRSRSASRWISAASAEFAGLPGGGGGRSSRSSGVCGSSSS